MNQFVIADMKLCIGCRTCEIACVMAHSDEDSLPMTAENFNPRLKVIKTHNVSVPILCRQCEAAPCLNACPNSAISHQDDSVQVQQLRCIGCKSCVSVCPAGLQALQQERQLRAARGATPDLR